MFIEGSKKQLGCLASYTETEAPPPRTAVENCWGTGPTVDVLTYQAKLARTKKAAKKTVAVEDWEPEYLQDLEHKWHELLQLDLAESSHRSYGWHQKQYKVMCQRLQRPVWPDPHSLAQFMIGRAQHGYARSTVEQGAYAIARWGTDVGVDGLIGHREVQRAMAVVAKVATPAGAGQKLPLDRRDLRKVVYDLGALGDNSFLGRRDTALLIVGWAGMFRSSELVGISWDNVSFTSKGGVLIYVPNSKTDQAGEGAWVFLAPCTDEQQLCPVHALLRLRAMYEEAGVSVTDGAVFRPHLKAPRALSKTTVAVRVRKGLEAVGVADWQLYAAHSLRRGGATWAVRQGIPVRQVMVMGRWKSDVIREYLYCSVDAVMQASKQMQRG